MTKILRRATLLALMITAVFALSQAASATPNLVSAPGTAAQYQTTLADGTVVIITNNYMTADVVEVTLPSGTVAASNTVYWVYTSASTDKSAQLGTVTVKKGASSGRLNISAGKLGDFSSGYLNVVTGSSMNACEYGPAVATTVTLAGNVSLRNSASGAELLIVNGSIVKKGMTATAIVNGRLYKATAKTDGVDLQVNLASNMEKGVTVWYTVAAAGCMEADYQKLVLGDVETTVIPASIEFKLFFQGSGASTSSIMLLGVKPGDTVRCYTADNTVKKSGTVPNGGTMITISGLKLNAGAELFVAITEKGKIESPPKSIIVPATAVPATLKSSAVTVSNLKADGVTAITDTTITIKNVTIDDVVTIYDSKGVKIDDLISVADPTVTPVPEMADVVFENIDLGLTSSAIIYISVTSGSSESAWLKITVPAAK